jgi:hypothetical protein
MGWYPYARATVVEFAKFAKLIVSTQASSNFRSNEFTMAVSVEKKSGSWVKFTYGWTGTRYDLVNCAAPNSTVFCPAKIIIFQWTISPAALSRIGRPAAFSLFRTIAFAGSTLLRRGSTISRTGTLARKRAMIASAMSVSVISSVPTSSRTVSRLM